MGGCTASPKAQVVDDTPIEGSSTKKPTIVRFESSTPGLFRCSNCDDDSPLKTVQLTTNEPVLTIELDVTTPFGADFDFRSRHGLAFEHEEIEPGTLTTVGDQLSEPVPPTPL